MCRCHCRILFNIKLLLLWAVLFIFAQLLPHVAQAALTACTDTHCITSKATDVTLPPRTPDMAAVDVIVLGAGISGLAAAADLQRAGLKVRDCTKHVQDIISHSHMPVLVASQLDAA